jgi:hypothetical protein
MNPVQSVGSSVSALQAALNSARGVEMLVGAEPNNEPDFDLPASIDALNARDPVRAKQTMTHFVSHVNAECFLSLLQIMDPLPDDERKRATYRQYYRQLRDVLTVPVPPSPVDPRTDARTSDPLW